MAKYRITTYREGDGAEETHNVDGYAFLMQVNNDIILKSEISILNLLPHLPQFLKALNIDPKAVAGLVTGWINSRMGE